MPTQTMLLGKLARALKSVGGEGGLPPLSPSLSVGVHSNGSVWCNVIMFIIIDTHTYTRSKTQ